MGGRIQGHCTPNSPGLGELAGEGDALGDGEAMGLGEVVGEGELAGEGLTAGEVVGGGGEEETGETGGGEYFTAAQLAKKVEARGPTVASVVVKIVFMEVEQVSGSCGVTTD